MYYRLKKSGDFQRLFAKGKRAFAPRIMMIYVPGKKTSFGISVSKKYGGSVQRNRIKRWIREAFRENYPLLCANYRIVFVPKLGAEFSFRNFSNDIRSMMKREGMI